MTMDDALHDRESDPGSGIAEDGVRIAVDGQELDVLYDPDRERAAADARLAAGIHALRVRVEDRAGNAAERTLRVAAVER